MLLTGQEEAEPVQELTGWNSDYDSSHQAWQGTYLQDQSAWYDWEGQHEHYGSEDNGGWSDADWDNYWQVQGMLHVHDDAGAS